MKTIQYLVVLGFVAILAYSCEEVSDMAIDRVASPVLLETTLLSSDGEANEIQATFYELDKSGILDQNVGIDSIPVANLSIQVLSGSTLIGEFSTDASGSFVLTQDLAATPTLEYVGTYKDVAFRFIR